MAVLTGPVVVASGGPPDGSSKWVVVAFKNVTAADTYDLANLPGAFAFTKVFGAMFFPTSNRTATYTVSTIATNTNVSMLGAGIAADAGYLYAVGE